MCTSRENKSLERPEGTLFKEKLMSFSLKLKAKREQKKIKV